MRLEKIEAAVLDGMRDQLRDPEMIRAYISTYNAERQRLASTAVNDRARIGRRLDEAQREIDRAVQNLVKGRLSEEEADKVLPALRLVRDQLQAELLACEEHPRVIALHPATIHRYLSTVEDLRLHLAEHASATDDRGSLVKDFRALVRSVTVHHPAGTKHIEVEVRGKLAALVGGDAYPEKVGVRLVAGEGLEPPTRGL